MDYKKIAQDILDNVGGNQNVKQVTHCFTRLRFVLKDESKANKEIVEHLEGVISVVVSGGQFQVVCGAKVTKIYDATVALVGSEAAAVLPQRDKRTEAEAASRQSDSSENHRDFHTACTGDRSGRSYQGSSCCLCEGSGL